MNEPSIIPKRKSSKFLSRIEIEDTNLSDGSFLILPPYTDIEDLKLIDIFKLSIGTFTILDGKAQGEIHSSQYSEQLDELTIVKIEDNGEEDLLFKVIENRPKIEIIDPLNIEDTNDIKHLNSYLQHSNTLEYLEQVFIVLAC